MEAANIFGNVTYTCDLPKHQILWTVLDTKTQI